MRRFKRFLSVLLCLAMLCSMLSAMATAETGDSTESAGQLLYKYNNTELREMSQFPTDFNTNHELYFYHGTADSYRAVTTITSSNTDVVAISDGTDGCYRVYIAGAGTTTLSYTVGTAEYSVEVTISEGSESPGGSGGITTLAMTAYQYTSEGTAVDITFPGGMEVYCPDTFFLQFKAGDITVTNLGNSNTDVVRVSESEIEDVLKVEMLAEGTAILSASVELTPYIFVITVSKSPESGNSGSGDATSAKLMLREISFNEETMKWYEDATAPLQDSYALCVNSSIVAKFYFVNGEEETVIPLANLQSSGAVSISRFEETEFIVLQTNSTGGTGTISYTYDGTEYTFTVNVPIPEDGGGSGSDSGDTGETSQLHIYDAWFDCWFTDLPAGNGWHGYFTFHTAKNGEKLAPETIEFKRTSGTIDVTVSYTAEDPQVEGLVWVENLYHIEVQGTGSGTLSITAGGKTYAATVTVQDSEGGGNSDVLTATEGLYIFVDSTWTPGTVTYSGSFSIEFRDESTDSFQFRIGDKLVTSGLTSSDEKIASVIELSAAEGIWGINMHEPGTVTLSVSDGNDTYSITVNVVDSSGDESGDGGETTADLILYMGQFVTVENGMQWNRLDNGANNGTMMFDGASSFQVEVTVNGSAVTDGVTSSNASVAQIANAGSMPGIWNVTIKGIGTTIFSVEIEGVTYQYNLTVIGDPNAGGSGDQEEGEGVDPDLPTANLFLWDAWFEGWWINTLQAGDGGWHGYFTLHAARDTSVKLTMDRYEFICSEGTLIVTLDYTEADPNLDGLVWVENLYHLQVSGSGSGTLKVQSGETVYQIDIVTNSAKPSLPVITLDGVDYTVGIGDANGSSITFLGQDVNIGCHPGTTFVIAAMSGYEDGNLEEAPAKVYEYITKIEVEVLNFANMDESDDQTQPNSTYTCGTVEYHGAAIPSFTMNAAQGDYFMSEIAVNVTIKDPETGLETTYSITTKINYVENITIGLQADGITTVAELNEIFASDEAFLAWMESAYPGEYTRFTSVRDSGVADVSIIFALPGGTLDDAIFVSGVTEKIPITLYGKTTGERTVLRGLHLKGQFTFIHEIDFVADPELTMTYEGESFTCGILLAKDELNTVSYVFASTYNIYHCNFTGFDYAVRCTDTGLGMTLDSCTIADCGVGFYMDSYDRDGGPWTGGVQNTLFLRNQTAVQIVTLPQYLSPYNFRVNDCDFISNGIDFAVDNPGIFYFYRNYYGKFIDPAGELSVDNVQYRTALASYNYLENSTIVVTNPRRIAPCTFGPEDGRLCIDPTPGLYTVILNGMADELVIDGESLVDMEEETEITVSNENEEEVGKWKFKEKKGHE